MSVSVRSFVAVYLSHLLVLIDACTVLKAKPGVFGKGKMRKCGMFNATGKMWKDDCGKNAAEWWVKC